jgi:hypothetical protein
MNSSLSLRRVAAVGILTTALAAGTVPAALAKSPVYKASGTCSQGAAWKIKAKADDGRVEVEFEVDSNRVGQVWTWSLRDNGVKVGAGSARTTAPSGSFEVERQVRNRAGKDTFAAYARHAGTGQTCSMRVVFPG